MKITDLLRPEGIKINAVPSDQMDAIDQLVALQDASGNIADTVEYKKAILAREGEFSTAVGDGIAIPHAKTKAVKKPGLAAMTLAKGVDWKAPDDAPATLAFMIAAPEGQNNVHLEMLAKLSQLLMHEEFANALRSAKTPEEFLATIDRGEAERDAEKAQEAKKDAAPKAESDLPEVLAITACPTGIAHTYMAAEALEKKATEMGIKLKAETQGSAGAKNVLTAEEIAHAKGIIIAADKNVERERFAGKPVYSTNVSAGIQEPEKLINIILNGEAPVQEGSVATASSAISGEKDSVGHILYKHLMNGVSHMLPFVIGGGILTAIAFLVDIKAAGTATYGSTIPAAALFKTIGGEAFGLMLPILAAYIAESIADRPGLAPGFVGGLFAKTGYDLAYLANINAATPPTTISGGFIAALFAGFAAGYLMLGIERMCDNLPASLEGIKPILLYPLLGILAIGIVMLVLNPLFGAINTGLSDFLNGMGTGNIVLLGAVVGGMMSIDMGGPFNKAAYVFGTAALVTPGGTTGQIIMASVMAGGMVPPLVIALSTTFFKNRWTKANRDAGLVNYIMGLSFISEGAIPYAAADPGHVLPSCIIGSAIAGGLSALFGCTLPAPHGGIWVIAVIGNPLMYAASVLIGSVVGTLIISLWKKALPASESGLA
ncbi:PTS fructose transporter subunit IIC [Olsenella sp. oral taxon 807]|uniref:PTS fructose transporter subunit IIABC n=1 Tax=Olsenella sp. oral taxon 807 TaxID=712411 RepID=UPI000679F75E|nr:fructose-specific PTS transporter subunit EIIC [Olsenella sp. oral taxon 807]AKT49120.1 PTS fructose transporter subunit IIC [Olsenella sp. oral taxon 807]